MCKPKYIISVDDVKIQIDFNRRVIELLKDMELDHYTIYGTILSLGSKLLELKDQEQLIIIDEFLRKGIVIQFDAKTTAIDVISVTHIENVYIKKGMKVVRYN